MSKRVKLEEDDEESSGDDSSHVESDLEIQVDFEANAINEDDYHGICRLLQQLFLKAPVNLCELATCIVNQSHIAAQTCDGDGEESEVYGLTTALIQKEQVYFKDFFVYLMKRCRQVKKLEIEERFQKLIAEPNHIMGVVLHERFLNIPVDIGAPLLKCLVDEVKASVKPFTKTKERKSSEGERETGLVLDFAEMEYLQKEAIIDYSYPVGEEHDTVLSGKWTFDDECLTPYRTVFVLTTESFYKAVAQLVADFNTNSH